MSPVRAPAADRAAIARDAYLAKRNQGSVRVQRLTGTALVNIFRIRQRLRSTLVTAAVRNSVTTEHDHVIDPLRVVPGRALSDFVAATPRALSSAVSCQSWCGRASSWSLVKLDEDAARWAMAMHMISESAGKCRVDNKTPAGVCLHSSQEVNTVKEVVDREDLRRSSWSMDCTGG